MTANLQIKDEINVNLNNFQTNLISCPRLRFINVREITTNVMCYSLKGAMMTMQAKYIKAVMA